MNLADYQHCALRTTNPALTPDQRLLDAAAGLAEEAGEVLGLVRKRAFEDRDIDAARFREELGDVLWCLAVTADSLGLSLDDVASDNVRKLERRHPHGFQTHDVR
jgi:NTP pyrophosphatase (non-canonical NTP hydrolase)